MSEVVGADSSIKDTIGFGVSFDFLRRHIRNRESLAPAHLPSVKGVFDRAVTSEGIGDIGCYNLLSGAFLSDPIYGTSIKSYTEVIRELISCLENEESLKRMDEENRNSLLCVCDHICDVGDQHNFDSYFY